MNPESLPARNLSHCKEDDLQQVAQSWVSIELNLWPEDVREVLTKLVTLGEMVLENRLDELSGMAQDLYGPHGEYVLAPVPYLMKRS